MTLSCISIEVEQNGPSVLCDVIGVVAEFMVGNSSSRKDPQCLDEIYSVNR
jgi:hypothetical protein